MSYTHKITIIFFYIGVYSLPISSIKGQSEKNPDVVPLTFARFKETLLRHHPIVRQGILELEMADATLLSAKGGFDPIASSDFDQKAFDGKDYFRIFSSDLKVPTPLGIDVKAGYQWNRGDFLDPENSTPSGGLFYAGLAADLGQGLWIDERRANLRKAKININNAESVYRNIRNELALDGAMTYWEWFRQYNHLLIYTESLSIVEERYQATLTNVASGDRPAIDTIETSIQLQNVGILKAQAEASFFKSSQALSNFFWDENLSNTGAFINYTPETYDLMEDIVDSPITYTFSDEQTFATNPYLEILDYKIKMLQVDRSLKVEKLKPKLNVNFNPLLEVVGTNLLEQYDVNNYKWGFNFKMPLFLRKERGEVKLANLKLEQISLDLKAKYNEILTKYNAFLNEWTNTNAQIVQYTKIVSNQTELYNAERRLFDIGESSLFLVNSREQALISARIKLVDIITKNRIAYYMLQYTIGRLGDLP